MAGFPNRRRLTPSAVVEHQPRDEADQRKYGVHLSGRLAKDELPPLGRSLVLGADQNAYPGAVHKSQLAGQ